MDWGHFGHLQVGRAKRALMTFVLVLVLVLVLSWSRQIFLRFYLNARSDAFLHGHAAAFETWGGVPRVLLYDNLRSAVLGRRGDTIEFNPSLLALAAHYRFEPRPVALARGNEKGRVERSIRHIRDNFFAARQWSDLEDLNVQAASWRRGGTIEFNPSLLALAAHYRFEPRPVALARGNEKGRVERSIRHIRDNFFAARQWSDLEDLNVQAASWRRGGTIEFNPSLLALAAHYRFEPRPVALARGNEKGRVERSIRHIRDNFFAARQWSDLEDLNAQAASWRQGASGQRPCAGDSQLTVGEAFEKERAQLLALPDNPFVAEEVHTLGVGKTPYVCGLTGTITRCPTPWCGASSQYASPQLRCVYWTPGNWWPKHTRVYGKGEQVENPAHLEALVKAKRAARHHRGQDRLARAVPSSTKLLGRAAERGHSLRPVLTQLERLLDRYGAAELEQAVIEALQRDVPHPNAVRQSLERRREQRDLPPPVAIALPDNEKARNIVVRSAPLAVHDQLHDQPGDSETQEPTHDDPH